jgi:hypothetical protein
MQQFVGSLPKPQSIVTIGGGIGPPLLSGGSRLGVAQPLEPGKLVCEQFALFIAPDKDLEHGAAIELMNCSGQDRRPKNGRSTK